jgi:hypothetical protein
VLFGQSDIGDGRQGNGDGIRQGKVGSIGQFDRKRMIKLGNLPKTIAK